MAGYWCCDRRLSCGTGTLGRPHPRSFLTGGDPVRANIRQREMRADSVEILSGFWRETTGTPISLLVRNQDQRSRDYGNIAELFRPGHADYPFTEKYGIRDYRGGGRSSGRETIGRVAAGAVASLLLGELGISVRAYTNPSCRSLWVRTIIVFPRLRKTACICRTMLWQNRPVSISVLSWLKRTPVAVLLNVLPTTFLWDLESLS